MTGEAMNTPAVKGQVSFPFVLEELAPLRPTVKRMFGFTYVYLDDRLLCSLRESVKRTGTDGMWLFTTTEHVESLAREFPQLSRRQLWRSGKNAWIVLASRLEDFEEYAFRACELILNGDRRIGRVTRGGADQYCATTGTPRELPEREHPTWGRSG